jgi:hypothetical protein
VDQIIASGLGKVLRAVALAAVVVLSLGAVYGDGLPQSPAALVDAVTEGLQSVPVEDDAVQVDPESLGVKVDPTTMARRLVAPTGNAGLDLLKYGVFGLVALKVFLFLTRLVH